MAMEISVISQECIVDPGIIFQDIRMYIQETKITWVAVANQFVRLASGTARDMEYIKRTPTINPKENIYGLAVGHQ